MTSTSTSTNPSSTDPNSSHPRSSDSRSSDPRSSDQSNIDRTGVRARPIVRPSPDRPGESGATRKFDVDRVDDDRAGNNRDWTPDLTSVHTRTPEDRARAVARRLLNAVGTERFDRAFGAEGAIAWHDGRVVIYATDRAAVSTLEKRFGVEIRAAVLAEFGPDARFETLVSEGRNSTFNSVSSAAAPIASLETVQSESTSANSTSSAATAGTLSSATPPRRHPPKHVASDRYRLESFVVGQTNRLAYNAAVLMAEGVESSGCSPLFIHGPCGVGKTHLLQGVAVRFKERHPGATVRVTSGEQFLNDFVAAMRSGSSNGMTGVERFRRSYRKVDLLCIDDVHFLASKNATQAELLHTFDEIERGGARIVLVSDEHPRQLSKFSAALVSRFMSGMVAGLSVPDAQVREKIIRNFAASRGMWLEDSAVTLLVERTACVPGRSAHSVREIEGMLVKVDALHRLMDGGMSREPGTAPGKIGRGTVSRALDGDQDLNSGVIGSIGLNGTGGGTGGGSGGAMGFESRAGGRPVRMDQVVQHTCSILGVDVSDLGAKTRHKRVVLARAVITHLARETTTMSYPEIARAIGRPNHSTVITAHQRLKKQISSDESLNDIMGGVYPGSGEANTVGALVRMLAHSLHQAARRGG